MFKHFIKKFKKDFSFRKNVFIFGGLGILIIGGGVLAANSDTMFASVLNLGQIAQQRKVNFSQKQKNTCTDTDGGVNYAEKGTITTIISGHTRIESDSCNTNETLREWFCGEPGAVAGLLRSENYVHCGAGYQCQEGACVQTQSTDYGYGDIIIQDIQLLPNNTPALYSDFSTNTFQITVKNIGTGTILLPINTTDNSTIQLPLICYFPGGGDGAVFSETLSQTTIGPNQSITTTLQSLDGWVIEMFGSPGTKSMTCDIVSQQQQLPVNPQLVLDINNPFMIYETNGTNNSFTTTYEVIGEPIISGDIIIDNMYITPDANPIVGTDNDTNKINLVMKNIGEGDIIIPYFNGGNRFSLNCNYSLGGGGFMTTAVNETILQPNTSTTVQIWSQGYDTHDRFSTIGPKSINCTIMTQQQQGWQSSTPTNTGTIYESNGSNNSFTLNYTVNGTGETEPTPNIGYGDVIIENISIQTNPAIVGSTTLNNKVYISIKNIGSGDIAIPYGNGANRFGGGCWSNEGSFSINTIGLDQTILGPNESISTELVGQPYNTLWYGSIGNKSMNCFIESQQQQERNTPNPNNTNVIYETDGTNNSFILNYEVVYNQ